MYNGQIVIDTDTHIREYVALDRTYRDRMDPEYRESYDRLSKVVAMRKEAGLPTSLFMNPWAIVEPSNEGRPLGVYDTFGPERPPRAGTLVERLDETYRPDSGTTPNLKRKPSEVLAEGRLFHAVESEERDLAYCMEVLGEDMWLFATDYPHIGSPWPAGVPNITERSELSNAAKSKLLGENAQRLFPRLAE